MTLLEKQLTEQVKQLTETIARLTQTVEAQNRRIEELLERLNKNSRNSSKPLPQMAIRSRIQRVSERARDVRQAVRTATAGIA